VKKIIKILVVIAAVFAALLIVASVALRIALPPEKAKALVVKQLAAHLHREVQVGDVSVGVLRGLVVSNLKISEAPDFSKGVFIASDQFSIRISLWPLLFKRVEVNELSLVHPLVTVIRNADGKTFNFSDLMSPSLNKPSPEVGEGGRKPDEGALTPTLSREGRGSYFDVSEAFAAVPPAASPAAPAVPGELPFSLLVSHASIRNGVVHFVDRSPARQSLDIAPLNLKLSNVSLTEPFGIQAALTAAAKGLTIDLQMSGQADIAAGSADFKKFRIAAGGATISLTGRAERLKTNSPSADLHLDIRQLTLAALRPFVALPANLPLNKPISVRADVKGDSKRMDITAQAAIGPLQLSSNGQITDLASARPQIKMHLETNTFPAAETAVLAGVSLPKDIKVEGNTQVSADVSGTQAVSHIALEMDGHDLGITKTGQFEKKRSMPLELQASGDWTQDKQSLNLTAIKTTLGSMHLDGTASFLLGGKAPIFSVSMKSNTWSLSDLAAMAPMLVEYHPGGNAVLDVRSSGTPAQPKANGTLHVSNGSARYEKSQLSGMDVPVSFTMEDVSIPKMTGQLDGAGFSLQLAAHKLMTSPDIQLNANFTAIDLNKLLPPIGGAPAKQALLPLSFIATAWAEPVPGATPPMKLSGHLTVGSIQHDLYQAKNLDFTWNLSKVTTDLSMVTGSANLRQGSGVVQNIDKLASLSKAVRIALFPLLTLQKLDRNGALHALGVPTLQSVKFDSITGDYVFNNGIMDIRSFVMNGPDVAVNTTGTIGLSGAQPLNVQVEMKLAKGSIGGTLGQFMQDENGRPTLKFNATGTVPSPKVRADVADVTKRALQQGAKQLLQGVLGGGQSSGQGQGTNQSNPADDIQKALKNIFH
jgi:hypothetical protein